MPPSPRLPDAAGLQARLEAAERLIGELREGMAVMAGAHRRELAARDAVIAGQAETIARQADRIAQLERRLGRDSSSSSKPPSSDSPFTKGGRDRSLREKTGRRPGKQPGAPGRTLGLAGDPDETIECVPAACGRCGRDLTGEPAVRTERRQRWDITAPPPPYITEYWKITKVCPRCRAASAGQVPADVASRVAYGPETRTRRTWSAGITCRWRGPRCCCVRWRDQGLHIDAGGVLPGYTGVPDARRVRRLPPPDRRAARLVRGSSPA
jgi:hypothetical protein